MNSLKYSIHKFRELDSTNDYALRNKDTFSFGDVIVADKQTNGHGRFDRKWISENEQNIYLTIVLGNSLKLAEISLYSAVVIVRMLESLGVKTQIKWPNDILIDDKKISGILVQNQAQGINNFVVVGVGINLFLSQEEKRKIAVPVACLNDHGVELNKDEVIKIFLDNFFDGIENFDNKGFSGIKDEYEIKSSLIGKQITVKCSQKELLGKVLGFSDIGEILIEENNQTIAINSGEVVRIL